MATYTCPGCGAQLDEATPYCTECGAQQNSSASAYIPQDSGWEEEGAYRRPPLKMPTSYAADYDDRQDTYQEQYAHSAGYEAPEAPHKAEAHGNPAPGGLPDADSPYAMISTGGFIGILFLMLVPGVNLIFLIIWACGGCRKIAKRSFARAQLVVGAVAIFVSMFVFYLAILAIEAALGMTISEFVTLMNTFL